MEQEKRYLKMIGEVLDALATGRRQGQLSDNLWRGIYER